MAIRKEKEEICGRLSTRVVYITEDGKRFCQESEAFLHDECLKWQQTSKKMGVMCIDGGYYCKDEQALAAVVIMMSYKTGRYDWKQKKFSNMTTTKITDFPARTGISSSTMQESRTLTDTVLSP